MRERWRDREKERLNVENVHTTFKSDIGDKSEAEPRPWKSFLSQSPLCFFQLVRVMDTRPPGWIFEVLTLQEQRGRLSLHFSWLQLMEVFKVLLCFGPKGFTFCPFFFFFAHVSSPCLRKGKTTQAMRSPPSLG